MKLSPQTIAATSTIIVSSFAGFAIDQSQHSQDSGLMMTLILATILTNFGLFGYSVPSVHPVYDLCWSKVLPASLALILFSAPSDQEGKAEGNQVAGIVNNDDRILNTKELIFAVGVPFMIGSIGSIFGSLFSRFFHVWAGSINGLKSIAISPVEASVAAGCLSASFIGGTVNFFIVSRILSKQIKIDGMNNLLSAMAAADMIVMVIYFGVLTKFMSWEKMNQWFPARDDNNNFKTDNAMDLNEDVNGFRNEHNGNKVFSGSIMIALAWSIVEASNVLESYAAPFVPGMQCAFVALFSTIINRTMNVISKQQNETIARSILTLKRDIFILAPKLSDFCFYLLFAAIGTSANLGKALSYGLPCIVFTSISLLIHVLTIFLGSTVVMKCLSALPKSKLSSRIFPVSVEEVCVASNAAIGGAITAATMAGKSKTQNRSGLVLAATFWGIIGYAIASTVGVSISLFLLSLAR